MKTMPTLPKRRKPRSSRVKEVEPLGERAALRRSLTDAKQKKAFRRMTSSVGTIPLEAKHPGTAKIPTPMHVFSKFITAEKVDATMEDGVRGAATTIGTYHTF